MKKINKWKLIKILSIIPFIFILVFSIIKSIIDKENLLLILSYYSLYIYPLLVICLILLIISTIKLRKEKKMFTKNNKKTISIEGMHCEHCAKKVENTLSSLEGVNKVKVNLSKKEAIIISKSIIDDQTIKDSFKDLDFTITNIK